MRKIALLIGMIFISTIGLTAAAGGNNDHIQCSSVKYAIKSLSAFKEAQAQMKIFVANVCETAPTVCPSASSVLLPLEGMVTQVAFLAQEAHNICQ